MDGGIYLIQNDGQLVEMRSHEYDSEALLQELLAQYPHLLAGEQMSPATPRRWILVSREASLPSDQTGAGRWSVDHLFLDQDAVPTLVEVKRGSDTRIRREVIGQMLDYAANGVVYWPVETIRAMFVANCQLQNKDPDDELATLLAMDSDREEFWQKVKTNLQAGRVRMVFVADQIPSELRRVVEFLNTQMDPAEVIAVEVKQYVGGDLRTLVPRVIGQTAEAQQRKSAGRAGTGQWDAASFMEELASRRSEAEVIAARKILEWAERNATWIYWGKGNAYGSFTPVIGPKGSGRTFIAVWTYGAVEVHFQYLMTKPPFDSESNRHELRQRLNSIVGVKIDEDAITKRPSISLSLLTDATSLDLFLATVDWLVREVSPFAVR